MLQCLFNKFTSHVVSGNSWVLLIIILIVAGLLCQWICMKHNMFGEWAFEPIVTVPKNVRQSPFVKTWFRLTRGFHYVTKPEEGKSTMDALQDAMHGPPRKTNTSILFSGWAFTHFLLHFCIAFFCPKLVYFSFIFGVAWEMAESVTNAHCALDILWNLLGALTGLLCRGAFFPPTTV